MVNGVTTTHYAYFMQSPLAGESALKEGGELPLRIGKSEASDLPDAGLRQKPKEAEAEILAYQKRKGLEARNKEAKIKPEDLVLKPSEVPFEERMKQVVSLETIQTLLLLRSPHKESQEGGKASFAKKRVKPVGKTIDKRG